MKYKIEHEIPEGYEARIEGNKVIITKKESEDERIKKELIYWINTEIQQCSIKERADKLKSFVAWLEERRQAWTEEDEAFVDNVLPRILEPNRWTLEQNAADRKRLEEFINSFRDRFVHIQKPLTVEDVVEQSKRFGREVEVLHKDEQKSIKVYDNMDDLIADAMIDEISESDMIDRDKHNRIYWINKHRQKPADEPFEEWIDGWYNEYQRNGYITMDEREFKNFCRGIRNMYQQKPAEETENFFDSAESYHQGFIAGQKKMKDDIEKGFGISEHSFDYLAGRYAGYEAGKQEQKPAKWSEEDKSRLDHAITTLAENVKRGSAREDFEFLASLPRRFYLQPKTEWSEEDEKVYQSIMDDTVQENQLNDRQTNWIRDIKYRYFPQPKQEWSEEDEKILDELLDHCNTENATWYNWLKSRCPHLMQKENKEETDSRPFSDFVNTFCLNCGSQRCTHEGEWLNGCPLYKAWKAVKDIKILASENNDEK